MTDEEMRAALVALLHPAEPWPGAPSPETIADALLPTVRKIAADVWDDGFEAGATWTPSGPSGIPHDPPLNPFRADALDPV